MLKKWISLAVICAMSFSILDASALIDVDQGIGVFDTVIDEPTIEEFDPEDIDIQTIDASSDANLDQGRLELSLDHITFDPLVERPILPKELVYSGNLYIVQFKDRIYPHTKDMVRALGAKLLQYIPQYAFAVRMDPSTAMDVRHLPTVRAVTPYHLFYKIAPDLIGLTDGLALVNFMAWKGQGSLDIEAHARAIGATIDWVDPLMVRAFVDRTQLLSIASNDATWYVQLQPEWEYHNNVDSDIINARHYPNGAYNNPADGIWSYSGGVGGTFSGLATGLGVIVSDVDTGQDGTHNNLGDSTDYPNKKVWFKSYTSGNTWFDNNGHGTHTAGTAVGIGKHRNGAFDGLYSGMAPEAGLVGIRMDGGSVYNWMNDPYKHGANLSTNSWGGGQLGSYDSSSAAYDTMVIDVDAQTNGDQHMLTFFSAGNSGANGVSPPSTAKNVITVGASGGTTSSANSVAGFSSRGPTADGRIKPDIVAPGTSITSSWKSPTDFTNAQGTSMSCPTTAGAGALIIEYYNNTYGFTPSPALVKALMVNGAKVLGYNYPGGTQGWGRLDLANTLIETSSRKIFHKDEDPNLALDTGAFVSYPVTVNSGSELRVHVAWLDQPGQIGANPSLVNDIDVRFKDPDGNTYMGNKLAGGYSTKTTNSDTKNNLEGLRFSTPMSGVWTLEIIGANIPDGPQEWALAISGDFTIGSPTHHFQDFGITEMSLSNSTPVEGDNVTISATIINDGNLPGLDIDYMITMDGSTLDSGSIPTLAVDQEVQVSTIWNAVRGNHMVVVEIDHSDKLVEINEDNNSIQQSFDVDNYGFDAKAVPPLAEVQPGENTTFRIEIENNGTLPDIYDMVINDPPVGFTFDLDTDVADLEIGKKGIIKLVVTTPERSNSGTTVVASVTITSRGNNTYITTIDAVLKIQLIEGFEMVPLGNTSAFVDPYGIVDFEMNITNLGNSEDNVILSLTTTNAAFMALINATTLSLSAYETQVVKLTVTPPFQAIGGDSVIITMNGDTSSELGDTETFMVTVSEDHNLSISTEIEETDVDPGGSLELHSIITDLGNSDESIEMWADLPKDWSAEFDEDIPYIMAYGFSENYVSIYVPEDALAGEYNISIGSSGDHLEYEEAFPVWVTQEYGVALEVHPSRSQVKQHESTDFTLTVTNEGNGEDSFDLFLTGGPHSLGLDLEKNMVTLGPGESVDVKVAIDAMDTVPGNFAIMAEAVSGGNKALSEKSMFDLQVIEVINNNGNNNNNNNNNNNTNPNVNVPEPADSALTGKYGLYLLVALAAIIAIVVLTMVALKKRKKANLSDAVIGPGDAALGSSMGYENMDGPGTSQDPPASTASGLDGPPSVGMTMGPPPTGPKDPPPMNDDPTVSGPQEQGALQGTNNSVGTQAPIEEQPASDFHVGPKDMGPTGPDVPKDQPSQPVTPDGGENDKVPLTQAPAEKDQELDSMISDLMEKMDRP